MLKANGKSFKDQTVVISGSGNVAIYATKKATEFGAKVVALSDSNGYIYDPDGMIFLLFSRSKRLSADVSKSMLKEPPMQMLHIQRDAVASGASSVTSLFLVLHRTRSMQRVPRSLLQTAATLYLRVLTCLLLQEAIDVYFENKMLYGPAKAANAGGVATSGLEMKPEL